MSTLQLENIKHPDASGNALELGADGSITNTVPISGKLAVGTSSVDTSSKAQFRDADVQLVLESTSTSNKSFIDFDGHTLQFSTNRDLKTGAFANSGYSNATMMMRGLNGGSEFRFYTAPGNNTTATNRMTIDSAGRVTMPYQPAACFSGQTTTSSTQRIGASFAELNNGGHLAVGGSFNGRFTCPVAGMYSVSMMTSTAYNGHYNWIEIRKNNTLVRDRVHWNKGGTSMHVNPSVQVITQCSAGDYLEAWQNNANNVAQDILDYAVINIHLIG